MITFYFHIARVSYNMYYYFHPKHYFLTSKLPLCSSTALVGLPRRRFQRGSGGSRPCWARSLPRRQRLLRVAGAGTAAPAQPLALGSASAGWTPWRARDTAQPLHCLVPRFNRYVNRNKHPVEKTHFHMQFCTVHSCFSDYLRRLFPHKICTFPLYTFSTRLI